MADEGDSHKMSSEEIREFKLQKNIEIKLQKYD